LCVCVKRVCHGQQQTKVLFRQYCVRLLRILEDDIIEYKSLRGNSYAILRHIFVISFMVICIGPNRTGILILLPVGFCAV
jgi:hypothetical protein